MQPYALLMLFFATSCGHGLAMFMQSISTCKWYCTSLGTSQSEIIAVSFSYIEMLQYWVIYIQLSYNCTTYWYTAFWYYVLMHNMHATKGIQTDVCRKLHMQ
jgi:hypothetical protein